jgi:hypothetical protein
MDFPDNISIQIQYPLSMKKYSIAVNLIVAIAFILPVASSAATNKLDGRFLLQVQNKGQLWYVSPNDHKRHMIKSGDAMFMSLMPAMQALDQASFDKIRLAQYLPAVDGIDTDNDGIPDSLEKLLGTNPKKDDTDGDGYSDKTEILSGYNPLGSGKIVTDKKILAANVGRIVTDYNSTWYINPADGRRYVLNSDQPQEIQKLFASLALGISNADLNKIAVVTAINLSEKGKVIDCGEDLACMAKAAVTCSPAKIKYHTIILGVSGDSTEEISKGTDSNCVENIKGSNIKVFVTANATAQEKKSAAVMLAAAKESSSMSCTGSNDLLVKKYNGMEIGEFSGHFSSDPNDKTSLVCNVK